ncbi:MAG: hypoxanthine phosphoribosyltransferase [Bacteroidia bacterium]|nr:hypoxanthine phosphoribosyltransferase [Bacteroidia bacterium]MCZ2277668.1 hypoxanthine phosphoribosyltransferase [Bacteroidia bacterium]
MIKVKDKTFKVLIGSFEIEQRVKDIAAAINKEYENKNPLFLGVLNGAFLFLADLFKHITIPCEIGFIRVASYRGLQSDGNIKNIIGLAEDLAGRHIIVVEDIVDTGVTATYLFEEIEKQQPSSLRMATLLFKPAALKKPIHPDYVGFKIEPAFVIGYGLDYDGQGRNLNDIYVLNET